MDKTLQALKRSIEIMARLRDPEKGCAWDLKQTPETIAPHALEEAYEFVDAVEELDKTAICEELGDMLLQVLFQCQMAKEVGDFSLTDVATTLNEKLERRHPHIFGPDAENNKMADPDAVLRQWDEIKAKERQGLPPKPIHGPPWEVAKKLGKRARQHGLEWDKPLACLEQVKLEIQEVEETLTQSPQQKTDIQEELGDVLFTLAQLFRMLNIDFFTCFKSANKKFERRLTHTIQKIQSGMEPEAAWEKTKAELKST